MVTKQEVDNILKQVNAILEGFNKRITELEESQKKAPTTRKPRSQEKDLTNE